MKKALITGITGQDGSFLAELLLEKGYDVYGIIRRSSSFNTDRIDHLYQDPHESGTRLRLLYGDLNDSSSLNTILRQVQPDEIYNLAAQSHVQVSFETPEYTANADGIGTLRLLEVLRRSTGPGDGTTQTVDGCRRSSTRPPRRATRRSPRCRRSRPRCSRLRCSRRARPARRSGCSATSAPRCCSVTPRAS